MTPGTPDELPDFWESADGMPEVRFHSGGKAPTAFNIRTVNTLKEIGIEVEPIGKEAARGEPNTANPVYRIRWGSSGETGKPSLEATDFSKHYGDSTNPQQGFAALMVCGEADAACPFVKGAALRVSMPYLDPEDLQRPKTRLEPSRVVLYPFAQHSVRHGDPLEHHGGRYDAPPLASRHRLQILGT